MYYYDPNDKSPRRWAMIAAAAYALLLAVSFALVSFDFRQIHDKPGDTILVDFTEPPKPEPPKPPVRTATEPRVHDKAAPVEQTAQVAGKDEVTQTPNPKALFKMNKGGVDEPDNAGNPHAPEGEDKASGTGPGLNPDGLDQLDQGLQGRGLVGNLPKPEQPTNKSGIVLIRVTIDASGRVTSAAYEPKGSTTSDVELVNEARKAALKTRFSERRAVIEGGIITYIFKLKAE
ncbi:energy transducer TonB [uncultured Alistipes sp.]|jgi:protein TonB|uniref:energy transducer TonB family protein n=1 Tax=uncultured Alistipes sp. TaxID=538949 RepID=UPI0025D0F96A|nr:energy transducer TonB [uncultured Alistipes sp.]